MQHVLSRMSVTFEQKVDSCAGVPFANPAFRNLFKGMAQSHGQPARQRQQPAAFFGAGELCHCLPNSIPAPVVMVMSCVLCRLPHRTSGVRFVHLQSSFTFATFLIGPNTASLLFFGHRASLASLLLHSYKTRVYACP